MTPVYKLSASSIKGRTNYGSMLAGNAAFVPVSYESIATVTVGSGGASDITFSSIGTDWTHLQLRFIARINTSNTDLRVQFNSDTASNYNWHFLVGTGSAVSAGGFANQSYIGWKTIFSNANMFTGGIMDILDYRDTNKFKTTRALAGDDRNGDGAIVMHSGAWRSTNAITSIKVYPVSGTLTQYSHFALYGIKGAAQ